MKVSTCDSVCKTCIHASVGGPFYGESGKADVFCNRWGDIPGYAIECGEFEHKPSSFRLVFQQRVTDELKAAERR